MLYFFWNSRSGILLIGSSLLLGVPLPLSTLQILWVNFFTDSFPAASFAYEDGHSYLQERPPKLRGKLFDKHMKLLVLVCGPIIAILLFGIYILLLRHGFDPVEVRTFIFAAFSLYTLFLSFSMRHLGKSIFHYNFFDNPYLLASSIFGLVLTALAIYLPILQRLFGTTALSFEWIAGVVGFGLLSVAIFEMGKFIFRGHNGRRSWV